LLVQPPDLGVDHAQLQRRLDPGRARRLPGREPLGQCRLLLDEVRRRLPVGVQDLQRQDAQAVERLAGTEAEELHAAGSVTGSAAGVIVCTVFCWATAARAAVIASPTARASKVGRPSPPSTSVTRPVLPSG